jgi:PAS domain-containing protein
VLDSLPLGAIAVGSNGDILFLNQPAAKLLDVNSKILQGGPIAHKKMGEIGSRMAQSLKEKVSLQRVYMDLVWGGRKRRFRIDSKEGSVEGVPWGTLFLLQEAALSVGEKDS